jgi:NADP-dependent alcohol dehydrogenase
MENFSCQNPVKILFGKGQIASIAGEIPAGARILVTYGSGSIKKNGVYEQVKAALEGRQWIEFGGIEANPRYETCMKGAELAREEAVDFLLAVGGGSVLDGAKFMAIAAGHKKGDPWNVVARGATPDAVLPIGCVLTLPATGSEMNCFSVITREDTKEKLPFACPLVYLRFSVLDPEVTFSLPPRQVSNGIVDAFVHTLEQYMTYPVNSPLRDRMAEAIFSTLIEEGPKTLAHPTDYASRANLVWCATMALNGLIAVGVPRDWATHMIGHELTVLYGLDHAQTLAIVAPSLLQVKADAKGKNSRGSPGAFGESAKARPKRASSKPSARCAPSSRASAFPLDSRLTAWEPRWRQPSPNGWRSAAGWRSASARTSRPPWSNRFSRLRHNRHTHRAGPLRFFETGPGQGGTHGGTFLSFPAPVRMGRRRRPFAVVLRGAIRGNRRLVRTSGGQEGLHGRAAGLAETGRGSQAGHCGD